MAAGWPNFAPPSTSLLGLPKLNRCWFRRTSYENQTQVSRRFQGIENAHMSLVVVTKIRKVFGSTLRNLFNRNAGGDGRFRDRWGEKYPAPHRPSAKAIGVTISVSLAFVIVPSISIRAARLWAAEWGTTPTGNKAPARSSWTGFNQKLCRSLINYCTKTVR